MFKKSRHLPVYSKTIHACEAVKPPMQGTTDGEVLWGVARFLKVAFMSLRGAELETLLVSPVLISLTSVPTM